MQTISNGFQGQFFTPTPICDMIAAMTNMDDSQPGQSVYDCACGSGSILLAGAKVNRHQHFYGADLDITCCKMALVNTVFNSLVGEVAHMNSLSNDFHTGYKIDITLVNTHYFPYYTEFTEPDQSRMWLHDLKGTEAKPQFDRPFEPVRAVKPINDLQGRLF